MCSLGLNLFLVQNKLNLVALQINADGVKRNFYPGDKLPLWHDELEPHNSLLDILAAGNPDPIDQTDSIFDISVDSIHDELLICVLFE